MSSVKGDYMTGHSWSDEYWREPSDNLWQQRLRRHQAWWRETQLRRPAGAVPRRDRPVASMLPPDAPLSDNLFTEQARAALEETLDRRRMSKERGILEPGRMRRNLLSSQPLCFNLFGYLRADPDALLPWVRMLAPAAFEVVSIDLESAPVQDPIGGSAFDAFVSYRLPRNRLGFVGIECKYAEDLKKSQTKRARPEYTAATAGGPWLADAADALDVTGLRQFWYNTLLADQVLTTVEGPNFVEGHSVVLALAADHKARRAASDVAQHRKRPEFLRFYSIEDVVASVEGHDQWADLFTRRYLDLSLSAGRGDAGSS
jgi:hypothetical protein